jgi:hypothetical protein
MYQDYATYNDSILPSLVRRKVQVGSTGLSIPPSSGARIIPVLTFTVDRSLRNFPAKSIVCPADRLESSVGDLWTQSKRPRDRRVWVMDPNEVIIWSPS